MYPLPPEETTALVILLFPEKKISLKYLYLLILIGLFFFLNYQGDNLSISLKISTYLLFFKSFSSLGPLEFFLGTSTLDEEVTDELLIELGQVTQSHTLPGVILYEGLIYIFASFVIFYILWRKNKFLRLPIIFLITYSLFSVTSFSSSIPLLIIVAFSSKGLSLYFARINIIRVGEEVAGELQKKIAKNILKTLMKTTRI